MDDKKKIKAIKELKNLLDLGLKEAKDYVTKVPIKIAEQVKKEDAEKIVEKLSEVGCTVELK